jgi:uroporphyrinogen-III synthase
MIYILSEKRVDNAISISLIKFRYFDVSIDISKYDAIIFTSRNGVRSLDKIDKNWIDKEIYSIGDGTTKEIQKYNTNITYQAKKFYGDEFAKELVDKLQGKRVLYPRAKVVLSNLIATIKSHGILLDDIITYETYCNDTLTDIEPNSTIIFSSPSTIECFFSRYKWDSSYKAIVIGTKTAQYMPKDIEYTISDVQTLQGCVDMVNIK